MTRRELLATSAAAATLSAAPRKRMTMNLDCGSIGVKATTPQALEHAQRLGFESIPADSAWLASLPAGAMEQFLAQMKAKGIVWGHSGVPVEFRKTEEEFQTTLKPYAARVAALRKAGVTRVTTWLPPASDTLTYLENFKVHTRRLREIATIAQDGGCRFGLEYVGPKTSWAGKRYPFVHSMKEALELIGEIGKPNVGLVMDSWHWYTAQESVADIAALKNPDLVVSVDLNDAPAGLKVDQQIDSQREIPCATGVIPVGDFLNALNKLGCDAPVRCEPFNAALRAMAPEEALTAVAASMKKAFGLIV